MKAGKGIVIGLCCVLLFACKTTKMMDRATVKDKTADEVFVELKKNEFEYQWVKAKFEATLIRDDQKTKLNGQLRIRKDSVIWLSVSPALGIEVGRMMITRDSVFLLDRMNNRYMRESISQMKHILDAEVDFDMLIAFLLGNDFSHYANDDFKLVYDRQAYQLSTVNRRKLRRNRQDSTKAIVLEDMWLDPQNYKILRHRIKDIEQKNRTFETEYDAFKFLGDQQYPSVARITIQADKKMSLELHYTKMEIEEPCRFPFKIPSKYVQINPGVKK